MWSGENRQLCWAGLQGWPWPLYSRSVMCLTYVTDLLSYAQNKWVIIFRIGEQEMLKLNGSRIFSELRGHASCFRLIRNEQLAGTLRRGCSLFYSCTFCHRQSACKQWAEEQEKVLRMCNASFKYLLNGFWSQWGFTCESYIFFPLVCQRSSLTSFPCISTPEKFKLWLS